MLFEITPTRMAIGNGWFADYPGPTFEIELLTLMLQFKSKYFHGSFIAFYFECWKEEGKLKTEISGDFLYLKQLFEKLKKGN